MSYIRVVDPGGGPPRELRTAEGYLAIPCVNGILSAQRVAITLLRLFHSQTDDPPTIIGDDGVPLLWPTTAEALAHADAEAEEDSVVHRFEVAISRRLDEHPDAQFWLPFSWRVTPA